MSRSASSDTESLSWTEVVDTEFRRVIDTVSVERKKLEEERNLFEREKLAWGNLESKLQISQKIPDTYFSGLVSGRWELNRQKDGSVFIDRDPAIFSLIMTYMRKYGTGFDLVQWLHSLSNQEKMLLQDEAEFFILPHLMHLLIPASAILDDEAWVLLHPSFEKRKLLYTTTDPTKTYIGAISGMKSKSNMLVVSKTEKGVILGAFTSIAWDFSGIWQSDSTAFLFCKEPDEELTKYDVTSKGAKRAVAQNCTFLSFGTGRDLYFTIPAHNSRRITVYCSPSSYPPLPIEIKVESRRNAQILEIWSLE